MPMANNPNDHVSTNICLPGVVLKSALIQGKLSVCCINSQSICARKLSKLDELRQILAISRVDVVCVTESWLNERIDNNILSIHGYHLVRHDRMERLGGGILIFVKQSINFHVVDKSETHSTPHTEYLALEILVQNTKILLACFYNPPEVDCTDVLDSMLLTLGPQYSYTLLLGDFNTNLLDARATKTSRLLSILSSFNLFSLGNQPTFFHRYGSSQLDLMLFNDESKVLRFNQVDVPAFSNHDLIFASLDFDTDQRDNTVSFRDYNSMDVDGLLNAYNELDWDSFYRSTDSNYLLEFFNSSMTALYDDFVPTRTFKSNKTNKSWFNCEIKKAIIDRDLAYNAWKNSKLVNDHNLFKRLRNKVNWLIRDAKKKFYMIRLDPKLPAQELWKRLKSIGVGKTNSHPINAFNSNEINASFARNFTCPNTSDECHIQTQNEQLVSENAFYFDIVSEVDVISAMYHVKSNAVGLDLLPLKFLKTICPLVVKPITYIFNSIIISSQYPEGWKKSKIIPIKKKSSSDALNNLRPISILSALSKVFERLLKLQICQYVEHHNLLSIHQSGYRPKHSAKTAMLKVFDDIGIVLDNGKPVILVLLDYSKAFDTISHKIMCRKLRQNFNFSNHATALIESYLRGRMQAVYSNGMFSTLIPISSGVPQGSILGPILFSLYINDLPNVLKYCKIHLFADDVQLYFDSSGTSASDIAEKINADLARVHEWSSRNMLTVNIEKTHAVFISTSRGNFVLKPVLLFNNTILEFKEQATSLGVTVQENFSFDKFILRQCGKVFAGLRTLNLACSFLSVDTKIKLFKSLLFPHFIACDFLLFDVSAFALSRLRVVLNSCVRYVFGLGRFSSVSHLQHRLLGCPFEKFGQMRSCLFIFNLATTRLPGYLFNKLEAFRSNRSRKYKLPRFHTSRYGKSFFVRGVIEWNLLPNDLTLERSFVAFRRKCIEYYN